MSFPVISILLGLLALYGATCWYVVALTIRPVRDEPRYSPADFGFSNAEEVTLVTEDSIRLQGWLVPGTENKAIIMLHGIHSNAWNGHAPDLVRAYSNAGFHVLLFDLRAHGNSGGEHLGLGWIERQDVRAAVDLMLARGVPAGRIGIHGTSYGAATAILAAAQIREIGAVIADTAFADVRDVISGEIERQTGIPRWFGKILLPGVAFIAAHRYSLNLNDISPERAIPAIPPRPILLIHGEDDPITPVESVERLYKAAGGTPECWILHGRQHTEGVRLAPEYDAPSPLRETFLGRVTAFFRRAL